MLKSRPFYFQTSLKEDLSVIICLKRSWKTNATVMFCRDKSIRISHGDFSWHPFTYFMCGEAIAEVGHLELIFISCPYLPFLRKIHCPGWGQTQRECLSKLRAKSTKAWTKKIDRFRSGGEHSPLIIRAHLSTRSRSWAWRNHKTLMPDHESLAIEGLVAMVFFVEHSHLLTAVSVVARAWHYRLRRTHAPGLLLRMWSVG